MPNFCITVKHQLLVRAHFVRDVTNYALLSLSEAVRGQKRLSKAIKELSVNSYQRSAVSQQLSAVGFLADR
jgi:hypothetical protein